MKLLSDWKEVLGKAWSVRLIAASLLCDLLGIVFAGWGIFSGSFLPFVLLSAIGAVFGVAAFVARLMAQRNMRDAP